MFGVMMLTILLLAMFGDLIFLASMLNTPLGRMFEPRKKTLERIKSWFVFCIRRF
jgi:hypothetical protein